MCWTLVCVVVYALCCGVLHSLYRTAIVLLFNVLHCFLLYVCMPACLPACLPEGMHACTSYAAVCMFACMQVMFACLHACKYVCAYLYVYIYICMYIQVHINMYMCIHIYIHIYILHRRCIHIAALRTAWSTLFRFISQLVILLSLLLPFIDSSFHPYSLHA